MNVVYTIAYIVLWPLFRILKPGKAVNREAIPREGGVLYCANHTRMSDPLYVAYALGWPHQIHVMAKEELMHLPILGWILRHGGIYGVKRGSSDVGAMKSALKCLKAGEELLIFPEGTRHQDGDMGDGKAGAAVMAVRTGVPIVPVYMPAEKHWFRRTPVVFGEPYYPTVTGRRGTAEEYRVIAEEIMARISALEEQAK